MICKDELKNLQELYPMVKDYIDEWIVVIPPNDNAKDFLKDKATVIEKDFTQPIEPEYIEEFKKWGFDVDKNYRIFNFVNARNESFKHATGDYILWLDADDRPIGLDNVKKYVAKYPSIEIFEALYDYAQDSEGNAVSDHVRERVVKNLPQFKWWGGKLGLIHETIGTGDFEAHYQEIPDEIFRVEHHSDHMDESSLRNHIALLYEYLATKGEDPRTIYYLGTEFFNRKLYREAIELMLEYVKVGGWDEERYRAWLRIAESYFMIKDLEASRNAYLEAVKELPHYPDAYLGLGESYYNEDAYSKAVDFIITGLSKKIPKTKSAIDYTKYQFRPYVFLALSYLELGKPLDACQWFARAAKLNPKHPWIEQYSTLFLEAKDLDDYVKAFVKIGQLTQRKYPKMLSKVAEIVPDELKDQEVLMDFKWRYTRPKVWGDKSVVFFASEAFEEWGPDSLKRGCGGSEEAIIQLAPRLVKLGWEVTVYNNCPKEETRDGVEWKRYENFNPRDVFNIIVGWRNNPYYDKKVAVKRFIDVHDVVDLKNYASDTLKDVTLLVKSNYHRETFTNIDNDDNFAIIPNGIDLKQFPKTEKTKNNLVWTSSYDRGLEFLLQMWPDIKREVPDVTLDCYYGFSLFDSTPWGRLPSGQQWKAKMQKLLEQDGVTDHGRVGSNEVARAYLKADVWAYPTAFPEISCITAMKAQAAGAIPVCTDYAALKETVKGGILIEGRGDQKEVQDKFKAELIALLKDDKRKEELRSQLNADEFDWDNIAKQWDKQFKGE